jgi:hypothetical protein
LIKRRFPQVSQDATPRRKEIRFRDGFFQETLIYIVAASSCRSRDHEEEDMGLKRKQIFMRQKAGFEMELQNRLAYLKSKGIPSPKIDKDTIVRKIKAQIKAMDKRLRLMAEDEKRAEETARIKAERATAAKREKDEEKAPKTKKASEESAGKKAKTEKKPAAPKSPEGGKEKKKPEGSGQAPVKKE